MWSLFFVPCRPDFPCWLILLTFLIYALFCKREFAHVFTHKSRLPQQIDAILHSANLTYTHSFIVNMSVLNHGFQECHSIWVKYSWQYFWKFDLALLVHTAQMTISWIPVLQQLQECIFVRLYVNVPDPWHLSIHACSNKSDPLIYTG